MQKDNEINIEPYEDALKSLQQLVKSEIVEMKSFKNPPQLVKLVMETICILFDITPDWYSSVKLLNKLEFLDMLIKFDMTNVSNEKIEKIRPYMNDPNFRGEIILKASKTGFTLFCWVKAIYDYHNSN